MKGRAERMEATVLRLIPYGDDDVIVGFLTPEHGRLSAFAPAARKSVKRFGTALDLFSLLVIEASPPRSVQNDLWRLTRVTIEETHLSLRNDLHRFASASYLAECIWLFAREGDSQPRLFEWWKKSLMFLGKVPDPVSTSLGLDMELLTLCGYGPRWNICHECGREPHGKRFFFSFDQGGISCESCRKAGEGRWLEPDVVRMIVAGGALSYKQTETARRALEEFTTYTLGRQPKSQSFRGEVFRAGG